MGEERKKKKKKMMKWRREEQEWQPAIWWGSQIYGDDTHHQDPDHDSSNDSSYHEDEESPNSSESSFKPEELKEAKAEAKSNEYCYDDALNEFLAMSSPSSAETEYHPEELDSSPKRSIKKEAIEDSDSTLTPKTMARIRRRKRQWCGGRTTRLTFSNPCINTLRTSVLIQLLQLQT
uniref:Uncharacterized protein n=1 Tax=Quercus lobata TaxID=97700 RepID=A0A7N2KQX4_QUELO